MLKRYAIPFLLVLLPIIPTFFGEKYVPIVLGALVLVVFFEENKLENLKKRYRLLYPYLFVIATYVVYTVLSPDIKTALKILERQTSLILLPVLLICCNWPKQRLFIALKGFVLAMLIVLAIGLIKLFLFSVTNYDWILASGDNLTSRLLYLQYKFPHILNTHPTYWSYLILTAIAIINMALLSKAYKTNKYLILVWMFLSVNIFYLAARTPIVIYLVVQFLFITILFKNEKGKKRRWYVLFFLILGLSVFVAANTNSLFKKKLEIAFEDERIQYWELAFKVIKENGFVLGEGVGQASEIVKQDIIENGDKRVRYKGYDLHNQYLRNYVEMGLLGILGLLYLMVGPLRFLKRQYNHIFFATLSFTMMFLLGMMTESYLVRLKGILLFSIATSLIFITNHDSRKESAAQTVK